MPERHPTKLESAEAKVGKKAATATRLRVTSHYAFYDDDGLFCAWSEGAIVTDPNEIELLEARGAPVERVE